MDIREKVPAVPGVLDRIKRMTNPAVDSRNEAQKQTSPVDSEMKRYFPGLYGGNVSTGAVRPHVDIQSEIAGDPERKRLYETATEFQSLFLNMMLKSMRSSLNKEDDRLYGGNRQDIFEDMLYNEYSKMLSKSPGFTLSDRIYEELSRSFPAVSETRQGASEYEKNTRRLDGHMSTTERKNSWEWNY